MLITLIHSFAVLPLSYTVCLIISTDGDSKLSGSIIAGIVTGAVILFSIVIILAIIIFKKVILVQSM